MKKTEPIEFLKDRVYLGAYAHTPKDTDTTVYFTVDDALPYNPFHLDFGPLNAGHLYRFAVALHEILAENEDKAVMFYSYPDPRYRANAACLLCCYMVLIQSWPPHLALAPIAQAEPPFMPFRDAGYSTADFILTIQDVVYGCWRAKEKGFLDLRHFNLDEYEQYEKVDQGDFNELPPHYIAFASPQQEDFLTPLDHAFNNVLDYFETHNVQLVVRLNSILYDARQFEQRGIKHIDMIFDDGTVPTMDMVKRFVGAAECIIEQGGKIAVHCKAGLGRTGCLIGAHLIYSYGFTAAECIAYMRFLRPGMVVGPQQHWLYLHQNEFRDWKRTMVVGDTPSYKLANLRPLVPIADQQTKLRQQLAALQEQIKHKELQLGGLSSLGVEESLGASAAGHDTVLPSTPPPKTPERSILGDMDHCNSILPAPTPGQPRKNSPSPAHRSGSVGISAIRPKRYISTSHDAVYNSDEEREGSIASARRVVSGVASRHVSRQASRSVSVSVCEDVEGSLIVTHSHSPVRRPSHQQQMRSPSKQLDFEQENEAKKSPLRVRRRVGSGETGVRKVSVARSKR